MWHIFPNSREWMMKEVSSEVLIIQRFIERHGWSATAYSNDFSSVFFEKRGLGVSVDLTGGVLFVYNHFLVRDSSNNLKRCMIFEGYLADPDCLDELIKAMEAYSAKK